MRSLFELKLDFFPACHEAFAWQYGTFFVLLKNSRKPGQWLL
jgi:hypothetical protein